MARFDRTIPPGGEGKIALKVKTKGYHGTLNKSAKVFTNDPKNRQLTISIKGKVWAPIQVKPSYVRLTGTFGDEVEGVIRLTAEKEEPLTVKLASVSIPDKVDAVLTEVEKGRVWELKVKNKAQKETAYRGQVNLTTNYPEKAEMPIQVRGNLRPLVEVRPKALNFGRLSEERIQQLKTMGKSTKRSVMIVLNKNSDLKINNVEVEKSLYKVIDNKEMRPGKMVQLDVEPLLDKLKKGENADRLKISTNQKDYEVVEVPLSLKVP